MTKLVYSKYQLLQRKSQV